MSELYEEIGRRIRDLRTTFGGKGMNQEELAKRMKTTANTISRWESATYKPSAMDLHNLAKIFSVHISVFFPGTEMPKLAALTSALGDLKKEDLDDITEYAQFRKARQMMKEAKKNRKIQRNNGE